MRTGLCVCVCVCGVLVRARSSVKPKDTRDIIVCLLESNKLKVNKGIYLFMSIIIIISSSVYTKNKLHLF